MNKLSFYLTTHEQMVVENFIGQLRRNQGKQLHGVILYGSKARTDADPESDIDLLLIVEQDDWPLRNAVSKIAADMSLDYDLSLSVHLVSLERWQQMAVDPFSFFKNVFLDGVPCFGLCFLLAPLGLTIK